MKNTMKLFLAAAALTAAFGTAHAEDKPTIEIMSSWTSGGEAAALNVIKTEFEKRGGVCNPNIDPDLAARLPEPHRRR